MITLQTLIPCPFCPAKAILVAKSDLEGSIAIIRPKSLWCPGCGQLWPRPEGDDGEPLPKLLHEALQSRAA